MFKGSGGLGNPTRGFSRLFFSDSELLSRFWNKFFKDGTTSFIIGLFSKGKVLLKYVSGEVLTFLTGLVS